MDQPHKQSGHEAYVKREGIFADPDGKEIEEAEPQSVISLDGKTVLLRQDWLIDWVQELQNKLPPISTRATKSHSDATRTNDEQLLSTRPCPTSFGKAEVGNGSALDSEFIEAHVRNKLLELHSQQEGLHRAKAATWSPGDLLGVIEIKDHMQQEEETEKEESSSGRRLGGPVSARTLKMQISAPVYRQGRKPEGGPNPKGGPDPKGTLATASSPSSLEANARASSFGSDCSIPRGQAKPGPPFSDRSTPRGQAKPDALFSGNNAMNQSEGSTEAEQYVDSTVNSVEALLNPDSLDSSNDLSPSFRVEQQPPQQEQQQQDPDNVADSSIGSGLKSGEGMRNGQLRCDFSHLMDTFLTASSEYRYNSGCLKRSVSGLADYSSCTPCLLEQANPLDTANATARKAYSLPPSQSALSITSRQAQRPSPGPACSSTPTQQRSGGSAPHQSSPLPRALGREEGMPRPVSRSRRMSSSNSTSGKLPAELSIGSVGREGGTPGTSARETLTRASSGVCESLSRGSVRRGGGTQGTSARETLTRASSGVCESLSRGSVRRGGGTPGTSARETLTRASSGVCESLSRGSVGRGGGTPGTSVCETLTRASSGVRESLSRAGSGLGESKSRAGSGRPKLPSLTSSGSLGFDASDFMLPWSGGGFDASDFMSPWSGGGAHDQGTDNVILSGITDISITPPSQVGPQASTADSKREEAPVGGSPTEDLEGRGTWRAGGLGGAVDKEGRGPFTADESMAAPKIFDAFLGQLVSALLRRPRTLFTAGTPSLLSPRSHSTSTAHWEGLDSLVRTALHQMAVESSSSATFTLYGQGQVPLPPRAWLVGQGQLPGSFTPPSFEPRLELEGVVGTFSTWSQALSRALLSCQGSTSLGLPLPSQVAMPSPAEETCPLSQDPPMGSSLPRRRSWSRSSSQGQASNSQGRITSPRCQQPSQAKDSLAEPGNPVSPKHRGIPRFPTSSEPPVFLITPLRRRESLPTPGQHGGQSGNGFYNTMNDPVHGVGAEGDERQNQAESTKLQGQPSVFRDYLDSGALPSYLVEALGSNSHLLDPDLADITTLRELDSDEPSDEEYDTKMGTGDRRTLTLTPTPSADEAAEVGMGAVGVEDSSVAMNDLRLSGGQGLAGGQMNDRLSVGQVPTGGQMNDRLSVGQVPTGGQMNDRLSGGQGLARGQMNDRLSGGQGLAGGQMNDRLSGGQGLAGGQMNDRLSVGQGLAGGQMNDSLSVGQGLAGGQMNDRLSVGQVPPAELNPPTQVLARRLSIQSKIQAGSTLAMPGSFKMGSGRLEGLSQDGFAPKADRLGAKNEGRAVNGRIGAGYSWVETGGVGAEAGEAGGQAETHQHQQQQQHIQQLPRTLSDRLEPLGLELSGSNCTKGAGGMEKSRQASNALQAHHSDSDKTWTKSPGHTESDMTSTKSPGHEAEGFIPTQWLQQISAKQSVEGKEASPMPPRSKAGPSPSQQQQQALASPMPPRSKAGPSPSQQQQQALVKGLKSPNSIKRAVPNLLANPTSSPVLNKLHSSNSLRSQADRGSPFDTPTRQARRSDGQSWAGVSVHSTPETQSPFTRKTFASSPGSAPRDGSSAGSSSGLMTRGSGSTGGAMACVGLNRRLFCAVTELGGQGVEDERMSKRAGGLMDAIGVRQARFAQASEKSVCGWSSGTLIQTLPDINNK
eukprot:gene18399-24870_t